MFIALVGSRCSGKTAVEDYLVQQHGFQAVAIQSPQAVHGQLLNGNESTNVSTPDFELDESVTPSTSTPKLSLTSSLSFLSMSSMSSATSSASPAQTFMSGLALLNHITQHWQADFVCSSLQPSHVALLARRPFVFVIRVEAPILLRWSRAMSKHGPVTLDEFVALDDSLAFESSSLNCLSSINSAEGIRPHIRLVNAFQTLEELHAHLAEIDLPRTRLRPSWDDYFMTLAELASRRSNCMKRRVGAVLVDSEKHIVATGYNGTARGLRNCADGGCVKCNTGADAAGECVCLHAEENALLEAGRARVRGAILYCNTCPCLRCTVKIVQTGVREVVYNLTYKVDDASAALFAEAGVILRRHSPGALEPTM